MQTWTENVPLLAAGRHLKLAEAAYGNDPVVYPPRAAVFRALELTPFDTASVVILGQDPYHGPGQAMGLAFSVPEGVRPPPSLRNIFREVADDVYPGQDVAFSTDLSRWACQGVLLLNAVLTVAAGKPGSHAGLGWQELTDGIIAALSERRDGLVFLLWGAYAQKKRELVDPARHLVLEAPHPSPFSAHRGFLGCRHFSQANAWLAKQGRRPVEW